jgi:hypothetical protein
MGTPLWQAALVLYGKCNDPSLYHQSALPLGFLLLFPGLLEQLFHGVFKDLLAGAAEPLVTDHA